MNIESALENPAKNRKKSQSTSPTIFFREIFFAFPLFYFDADVDGFEISGLLGMVKALK